MYRNVPKSVLTVQGFDVPKDVPKRTETYRCVPKQPTSGVPKRTERVYRHVQVRYMKGFGTWCGFGGSFFGLLGVVVVLVMG